MSTGIPRPLSTHRTPPSERIVTSMWSQNPASASSTELSTISETRWCRPRGPVEPMYMPGRLRTASSPSRTVMSCASYELFCCPLPGLASATLPPYYMRDAPAMEHFGSTSEASLKRLIRIAGRGPGSATSSVTKVLQKRTKRRSRRRDSGLHAHALEALRVEQVVEALQHPLGEQVELLR